MLNNRPKTFFTKSAWISLLGPNSLLTFCPYYYSALQYCLHLLFARRIIKIYPIPRKPQSINFIYFFLEFLLNRTIDFKIYARMIIRSGLLLSTLEYAIRGKRIEFLSLTPSIHMDIPYSISQY